MKRDLAWAAGLFEGEGCISMTKIKTRKDSLKLSVAVCSTDEDVITAFTKIIGYGKKKGPYKSSYPTGKIRWIWEVQNQPDCLAVLSLLLPYLCARRKAKAKLVITEIKKRLKAKNDQ